MQLEFTKVIFLKEKINLYQQTTQYLTNKLLSVTLNSTLLVFNKALFPLEYI